MAEVLDRRDIDASAGVDGLLRLLFRIFRRARVQKVVITPTAVHTTFLGDVGETLFPPSTGESEDPYEDIRTAHTLHIGSFADPYTMLLRVFRELQEHGLVLRGILLSTSTEFWSWAGTGQSSMYLGYPVWYSDSVPEQSISFVGAVSAEEPLRSAAMTLAAHFRAEVRV